MAQTDRILRALPSESEGDAPCPSVEDLMAFALGKLDSGRIAGVHLHLDGCEACQHVLNEAAHALATAVTDEGHLDSDVVWNTTFQRGTIVGGRYEIREFIARGGMGEVYEAFDRELRERVALKTVASTVCDNLRAVRRLKGEVQLARRVSHPNVCRIYDVGSHALPSTGAQLYFLTMEFVEGETLGQRVRLAGALPEVEARKIARELLLALGAAHEAGVLHRDFKSDNVMLKAGPDGLGTAVVLDFGLARALDHQEVASTSNPQFVGTFGYIAPEQIDGRPHTTASDVYAFGVVWYEMLTGDLPFRAASSPAAAALRSLERAAPPPSRLNPSVPAEIDALVLKCLERAPAARFQTASEVLEGLGTLRGSSEVPARPRWLSRSALAAGATAAALALLVYWMARPPASTPVSAVPAPRPAPATSASASLSSAPVLHDVTTSPRSPEPSAHPPRAPAPAGAPATPKGVRAFATPGSTVPSTAPSASATAVIPRPPPPVRSAPTNWENPFSAAAPPSTPRATNAE
ncbi:MAG TPA: serine/threonine-protein kinase [Polyangiaceae bacterium]|nr:serine/threonine-protein kinase [Polyangiaceae bacterium]